uniref:Uncharacterized protein n=1 Tax=Plectus sambesii TaxID=2011161 RepID=A0A914W5N5_9BILA
MKLFCRYRKSCYEKFGLDDDDDDEEEADKKKPVPSPPHPAASPKEARREAAAPKAATDNIGATTKPSGKSPQQAAVQPTPEQKTVSRQATKNAAHLAVAVDGSKCHKYRISCREQLGLPPKEKVPIGPNGKKLCRKKPKSS